MTEFNMELLLEQFNKKFEAMKNELEDQFDKKLETIKDELKTIKEEEIITVIKKAFKDDFEKIDKRFKTINNKFDKLESEIKNLRKEINIVKYSQEVINYSTSGSVSKPLDSFSTTSLLGEPITVNSYDRL